MNAVVQYLHDIALLECQLYTQNRIISSLNSKISKLGIAKRYKKPTREAWKVKIPFYRDSLDSNLGYFLFLVGAAATVIMGCIGMCRGIFRELLDGNYESIAISLLDGFPEFFAKIFGDSLVADIILILICAIAFVIAFLFDIGLPFIECALKYWLPCVLVANVLDFITYNTSGKNAFNEKMGAYDEATQKDALRVQKELSLKQVFQAQLQDVQRKKAATTSTLASLYDIGVIHPKYRHNIVAVSSFYDYFDTGRCLCFTGPGGAYDTFENDLHFHRLETKLDVIITKLDEIIENQRTLSDLMRDANNTLYRIEQSNKKMMGSMSRIESNSEITAYNTRCTMESNKVIEHIAVYNALRS